jgi:hypothetical protein
MATGRRLSKQQVLNRREALKALAALGGAAAAGALVPESWVKPVVKAGVVPAHAQSSNFIVQCHIHDLAFIHRNGNAKEWVPAAGDFRLEALGQVVPPVAGLPMQIEFVVKRPYRGAIMVFHYYTTNETDSEGIVSSGPLQVSILAGDGVYFSARIVGALGYCGDEFPVP